MISNEQLKDLSNGKVYSFLVNSRKYSLVDAKNTKIVTGEDYNYVFDKRNGNFSRWGKTFEDDPSFSPIGPEILDIEITTKCNGVNGKLCPFCYKSNTPNGKSMSFDTFKQIMSKMGPQLTQVAFGADAQATSNEDLWEMADHCRALGVVPNITVAEISDEVADKLSNVMGAVAVSRYEDKDICYDSVKALTDRGMSQVNMHFMIAEETYDRCIKTLNDIKTDKRLEKLNAIVLLSLKQKGRGTGFTPLSSKKYNYLVRFCLDNHINFGMDSCGAKKFLDAVKDHPDYEHFKVVAEPCESTAFSQYIDVDGQFFPCSFSEGTDGWAEGIDVVKCSDFLKDIWYNERVVAFRDALTNNCSNCHKARECPLYTI
jgi:hypothetical protein